MLGDLRKKLATVGRLDLMRSVDDEATAYFATLDPRDLTDTALEQQARLLADIGQVRLAEGNFVEAMAAFREALDRSSALYKRAPGNGKRLYDLAQAEYWIGFASMQKGDDASAGTWFREYHDSAVKLAAMDRHNFDWQKEVAYGLQALAVMDKKMGRTAEAQRGMLQQLALYRGWLKQRPDDPQLRSEAANVVSWLGSLALEQGQLGVAETYFTQQVRVLQQNVAAEPDNADWKVNSVDALAWLAHVQAQRGQRKSARANLAAAASLASALYAKDPTNNDWRTALAQSLLSLSDLDAVVRPRAARAEAERAMALMIAARAKDTKSRRVMLSLVRARNQVAELALARGDPGSAGKNVAVALALLVPAWKGRPSGALRMQLAQTRLLQGEIAQREGRTAAAKAAWNQTRELLLDGPEPEIAFNRLDLLVRALQWLGRGAEAAPYLKRLTAAGYVPLQPWPDQTTARQHHRARRTSSPSWRPLMSQKTSHRQSAACATTGPAGWPALSGRDGHLPPGAKPCPIPTAFPSTSATFRLAAMGGPTPPPPMAPPTATNTPAVTRTPTTAR
jgi:tetratricopeptide (TPR) repeat protein